MSRDDCGFFGRGRRGGLGDDHHGGAQQPAVQRPGLRSRACMTVPGGVLGGLSCSPIAWCRFGVEWACRSGPPALDPVALQQRHEAALHALRNHRARLATISGLARRAGLGRLVDAAPQILRRLDDVAWRISARRTACVIVDVALGAGAHIGHLGLRAHPFARASRCEFGFQFAAMRAVPAAIRWSAATSSLLGSPAADRRPRSVRRSVCMARQLMGERMRLGQAGKVRIAQANTRRWRQPSNRPTTRAV